MPSKLRGRNPDLEHEQGYGDGKDAVAECLHPCSFGRPSGNGFIDHAASLAD